LLMLPNRLFGSLTMLKTILHIGLEEAFIAAIRIPTFPHLAALRCQTGGITSKTLLLQT